MSKKLLIAWLVIASSLTLAGCGTTPEQPTGEQPTAPEQMNEQPTTPEQPTDEQPTVPSDTNPNQDSMEPSEPNATEPSVISWDIVENSWSVASSWAVVSSWSDDMVTTGDSTVTVNE